MAGFDRSKLRATTGSALQTQQKDHETKRPPAGYDRVNLEIKPGSNKFRIFPFHPDSGIDTYSVPKTVSFLTVTKPKRDENGRLVEGETEVKKSPVFNSKVHGNLPKDLVEEYMTIAKTIAIPAFTDDAKTQAKIWNYVTYAGKGSKAIKPSDVWVVYAMKEEGKEADGTSVWGKIGQLELKRTITTQMTEQAVAFSGDVQTPDIYTDPDDGICVIITKTGVDKDTEYKASLDTIATKQGNKLISESVPTPLTNEQLEAWFKLKPLAALFVNSFKQSDFRLQIEGLQNFDRFLASQGYPINVTEMDEFVSVVDELAGLLPEDHPHEEEVKEEEVPEGEVEVPQEVEVIQEEAEEVEVPVVAAPVRKAVVAKPVAPVVAKPAQRTTAPARTVQAPAAKVAVAPTKAVLKPTAPVVAKVDAPVASGPSRLDLIKAKLNKG